MSEERGSVEIVDVTKRFGSTVAVDNVTSRCSPASSSPCSARSGCGKTTTLRMLAGFEQPDEGFIRISGEYVQGVPPYKRDVNTVFQHYALFPHMTVAENVAYGLRQKADQQGRGEPPGRRGARDGEDDQARQAQAAADVGRPAAASGARPRPRQPAVRAPARRAARRPRPQAAPGDADRAQAAPEPARHHVRVRDPRPGRGAVDVRPHRGHARRPRRAAGRPGRDLRASGVGLRRRLHRPEQLPARASLDRRMDGYERTASPWSRIGSPTVPRPAAAGARRGAARGHRRSAARSLRPGRTGWPARWPASPTSAT